MSSEDDISDSNPSIKESRSSNFFLPLNGQENISRLNDKFKYNSDNSDSDDKIVYMGKVSQWKLDSSSSWLNSHSPVKRKSRIVQPERDKQKKDYNKINPSQEGSSELKCVLKSGKFMEKFKNDSDMKLIDEALRKPSTSNFEKIIQSDQTTLLNTEPSCSYEEDFSKEFSIGESKKPQLSIPPVSAKINFHLDSQIFIPAPLNQYLRDYQREGIQFLYEHYINKTGAILADDMGLGKTIQVIGFLSAVLGKQGNQNDTLKMVPEFIKRMYNYVPDNLPINKCHPFLIIGPSAVLYNWLDELNTWGFFMASKFHGADKDTCLSDLKKGKLEIVLTTFETYRDNADLLNKLRWEAVFVDEVHKIKVTKALRFMSTPCRFGLTGTALQNNLTELWSLLDWSKPGVLGTLPQFEKNFIDVIELGQRHDATKRELAQARKQKDKFAKVRQTVMLRRTKALTAHQLPRKEDLVILCKLTDLQVSIYKAILTHPDMYLILHSDDPCDCRSGKMRASCCYKKSSDGSKIRSMVFSFMHILLKAANHIALLIPDNNKLNNKQAILAKNVCEIAFKDHPHFIGQTSTASFRTLSNPKYCGKMKILEGLLSVFHQNHDKVLIFSYSTKLLDIIEQYIIGQGHEYRRIDGKVSSLCRRNIVIEFNKDQNIFLCLISTKAGGLGLNMTAANKVIIFDPNWNPSHDLQAQDRAYRIGQCRDVQVFRLVSAGTIEENIYLRQIYKQQLDEILIGTGNARRYFCGVQGSKANQGELFGIKNLFSLRPENSSLTMDIFKRNEKIEKSLAGYNISHYVPSKEELFLSQKEEDGDISDSNDMEIVSTVDTDDDDKEDELFFKNLFGSDISQSKSSTRVTLTEPQPLLQDEESDEEFSLIPKLYGTKYKSALPVKQVCDYPIPSSAVPSSAVPGSAVPSSAVLTNKNKPMEEAVVSLNSDDESGAIQCIKSTYRNVKKHQDVKIRKRTYKRKSNLKPQEEKVKFTSVKSVLEMEGVLHTLKNNKVVGSSRAEDHMTRCAMEDVFQKHINSQAPAVDCQPYSQHEEESNKRRGKRKKVKDKKDVETRKKYQKGHVTIIFGQTPAAIIRQQWSELCKSKGVEPNDLARRLIHSTAQDRSMILKEFYQQQFPELIDTINEIYTQIDNVSDNGESTTNLFSKGRNLSPLVQQENITSSAEDISPLVQQENITSSAEDMSEIHLNVSTLVSDSQSPHLLNLTHHKDNHSVKFQQCSDNQNKLSTARRTNISSNLNINCQLHQFSDEINCDESSVRKQNISSCKESQECYSIDTPNKKIILSEKVDTFNQSDAVSKKQSEYFQTKKTPLKRKTDTMIKPHHNLASILDDIFHLSDEESVKKSSFCENVNSDTYLNSAVDVLSRNKSNSKVHPPQYGGEASKSVDFTLDKQSSNSESDSEFFSHFVNIKKKNTQKNHNSGINVKNQNSEINEANSHKMGLNKDNEKLDECDGDRMMFTPFDGSESLF
ncbi:DNA excision repair protein ERCC-6-like 2 [Bulinus truncatus]|nr:DNA excision repair protein ERCC-6-like 2 [Bulinus truncatus]